MNETINLALMELEKRLIENDLEIWTNLLDKCQQLQTIRYSIILMGIVVGYLLYRDYRFRKIYDMK